MSNKVNPKDLDTVTQMIIFDETFNMYGTKNEPIFLAQDIAEMIDYSRDKVDQMLANVDDSEKLTDTIYRKGQKREMWFVTEFGLYELLMQSRKPLAKKFKAEVKRLLYELRTKTSRTDSALIVRDARIIFRNFSGIESKFNRAGDRNFCVILDNEEQVTELMREGWNVKTLHPRDEEEDPRYYIQVAVNFNNIPPRIVLVTSNQQNILDEETIGVLDYADIVKVDLTIRPYNWEVSGKTGIKAYLKTMYVTIQEDEFANEYTNKDEGELPFDL